jgi:putative peptidoglycan lipid II flippase
MRLMLPRLLGLAAFQFMQIVTFWLASGLTSARNTAIYYAFTLVMFPVGALGTSLGVAIFPTISRQAAVAQTQQIERVVADGLRTIMFLALPATAGLIILRTPIVQLLFHHGAWTSQSTAATTYALGFYALAVPPLAAIELCTRAFYAMKNTRTPVACALIASAVDVVLCIILFHAFGPSRAQGGLGLGTSLAVWLQIIILAIALRRHLPGLFGRALRNGLVAITLATVVMSVCVFAAYRVVDGMVGGGPVAHGFADCFVSVGVGIVIYAAIAYVLRMPELGRFVGLVGRLTPGRR